MLILIMSIGVIAYYKGYIEFQRIDIATITYTF